MELHCQGKNALAPSRGADSTTQLGIYVADSKTGKGAFAIDPIAAGKVILEYKGPRIKSEEMPVPYDNVVDHYIQIGEREYLGPSGEIDDFVNHSCDPNSGIRFSPDGKIHLVSLRNIGANEEITIDYSTTMNEDNWELPCSCGAASCRGRIRDFKTLPADLQRKYFDLEVVPHYIKELFLAHADQQ